MGRLGGGGEVGLTSGTGPRIPPTPSPNQSGRGVAVALTRDVTTN